MTVSYKEMRKNRKLGDWVEVDEEMIRDDGDDDEEQE